MENIVGLGDEKPKDGRKYHVGDKVNFTDDGGKQVPGVVHAVRYQQGHYELVGGQHETASDPTSPLVPGTGQMQVIAGTEQERHSFEYILVHEAEHTAWWDVENKNLAKLKSHREALKKYQLEIKDSDLSEHEYMLGMPKHPVLETHPELKQHIRIYEAD